MKNVIRKTVSFLEHNNQRILIVLIVAVITTGIVYSVYLGDNLRFPDEQDYYKIASNLISNHQYSLNGVTPTAFWPPGYPFTLAFFMSLGASIVHLRIINFVLLAFCLVLLNKTIKREATRLAAAISILLVIGLPVLLYTAGALYPQTLASFLLLWLIYLLSGDIRSKYVYGVSGVLLGYLILTIPMMVVVMLIFILWYGYAQKLSKYFFITVIVSLLFVGAWSVRNYFVFNAFVFTSTNSGLNLLYGNSENTTPNAGVNADISKYTTFANEAQFDEVERDSYYRSEAINFILRYKFHTIKLYGLKFLNYFNYHNELWTKSEGSILKDLVMLLTYGPLLLIFLLRLVLVKKFTPSNFEILLISLYLSSAMFYAIFFTRIRFRLPFDFLLIGLVALFAQKIIDHFEINAQNGHP